MGLRSREREYWHPTDSIEYSVQHLECMCVVPNMPLACRGFMLASMDGACPWLILCLSCNGGGEQYYYKLQEQPLNTELREEYYYQFQEQQFTSELCSRYPDISCADASKVTETFMEILQIANATHKCPECNPGVGLATSHNVSIKIQPRSSLHHAPAPELDLIFEQVEDDEEAVRPRVMPATTASIMELLKASRIEYKKDGRGECPICLEDMETSAKNRIRMPCSHLFHRACLINWLNNSHLCPLCRYQMPPAQVQYD